MMGVRCLRWVFLCLIAGVLAAGCSRPVADQSAAANRKWICDRAADQAMKEKDYRRGIFLHQRLLKKSPRNALAMYHLGYAYGQIGDHAKEIVWYKKAISLGFREGQIFFNLGMAYGETNQVEEAIKALKEAVRIDPENAEYHYGLAMAYRANGQERRCREELLETLKKEPGHTDAKRALQESHINRQDGPGSLPMGSSPPTLPSTTANGSGFVMQIAEIAIGMNGYVAVPEKQTGWYPPIHTKTSTKI